MAVTLTLAYTVNSQSVVNNTSNVTVKVNIKWTGGSYNLLTPQGSLTINGTKYGFSSGFNPNKTTSGTGTLFTKTVDIKHDSDGTKTLSCSASFISGTGSGTIAASFNRALPTIPRKSTLSVGNGTLGTEQTLTVSIASTSFTHTITATCGTSTVTVCTKDKRTSIPFTPPLDWASNNTTGTSVTVNYTITTYSGTTNIGSNGYSKTCSIPSSVKPSCTLTVTDATGYDVTYGNPIKGLSKFKVTITPTLSYGSAIKQYYSRIGPSSLSDDGATTYSAASYTTGEIGFSGTAYISARVKDNRDRWSDNKEVTKTVLDYAPPAIQKLTVKRCDADGEENDQGENVQVTFSASVTNLSGKNTPKYILKYKKSSQSEYTPIDLSSTYAGVYTITDGQKIFAADSGSSYDITLEVSDNFTADKPITRSTSASTGFTIMHWRADGTGMGIGKVGEERNTLDIGMQTRLDGGLLYPILPENTDLDTVMIPNNYTGDNISTNNYLNCPCESGTFTLTVEKCGPEDNTQVRQIYTSCSKYKPQKFIRTYYQGAWGPWAMASAEEVVLYENESGSNGTITLKYSTDAATSSNHYQYLEIYYTDNNGKSGGYTKVWKPNGKTITLQLQEPSATGTVFFRQTTYTISGSTVTPDTTTASYLRYSGAAWTPSVGTNYIKIQRIVGIA